MYQQVNKQKGRVWTLYRLHARNMHRKTVSSIHEHLGTNMPEGQAKMPQVLSVRSFDLPPHRPTLPVATSALPARLKLTLRLQQLE